MGDTVFSDKNVVAKKAHRCAHCGSEISTGTRHRSVVQVYDGQFDNSRTHYECDAAFHDLNFKLRDANWCDDLAFLIDDEIEDGERGWLREVHPIVAGRLWPSLPTPEDQRASMEDGR